MKVRDRIRVCCVQWQPTLLVVLDDNDTKCSRAVAWLVLGVQVLHSPRRLVPTWLTILICINVVSCVGCRAYRQYVCDTCTTTTTTVIRQRTDMRLQRRARSGGGNNNMTRGVITALGVAKIVTRGGTVMRVYRSRRRARRGGGGNGDKQRLLQLGTGGLNSTFLGVPPPIPSESVGGIFLSVYC